MTDKYADVDSVMSSARKGFAITPHDTTEIALTPKAVWVGGAGNLVVRLEDDSSDITISGIAAGTLLPIRPKLIKTTSTATLIIGLY
jgi:hypothetical protein